jgi:hypothetical protein
MWQWDRFLSQYFIFPLSLSFHQCFVLTLTLLLPEGQAGEYWQLQNDACSDIGDISSHNDTCSCHQKKIVSLFLSVFSTFFYCDSCICLVIYSFAFFLSYCFPHCGQSVTGPDASFLMSRPSLCKSEAEVCGLIHYNLCALISLYRAFIYFKRILKIAVITRAEVGTQILNNSGRHGGSIVQTPRQGDYPILCSLCCSEDSFVP